jgi:carbon monoxide dehydrogenase subunit G
VKIQGQHSYAVSRDLVWQALMDPHVLARTLPGCDELVPDGESRFRGGLTVKVGPVQGRFAGLVELSNLHPPERFNLHVLGQGPHGFLDGRGAVRLEAAEGATNLLYDIDANIGGRIATVGQRLLDSTARAVARQALDGLGRQLEGRHATGDGPAAGDPPNPGAEGAALRAAPTQSQFATAVARNVAADLLPRDRRVLVLLGVAGVAIAAWLCWRWVR